MGDVLSHILTRRAVAVLWDFDGFGLVLPQGTDTTDEKLTQEGAVAGTPEYMLPEQSGAQVIVRRARRHRTAWAAGLLQRLADLIGFVAVSWQRLLSGGRLQHFSVAIAEIDLS